MRGFTPVPRPGWTDRSASKQAIDRRSVVLPRPARSDPSGAMITVTDAATATSARTSELPRDDRRARRRGREQIGACDGARTSRTTVTRARPRAADARALAQIKLTAGGGVASPHSPLDVFDLHRGGTARRRRGRRRTGAPTSTVHAYTPAAVQRAIDAGVKCIEHAHLMDDATARHDGRERRLAAACSRCPTNSRALSARFASSAPRLSEVFAGTDDDLRNGVEVQASRRRGAPTSSSRRRSPARRARCWWRRRESNPRPQALHSRTYMLSRLFDSRRHYPSGREDDRPAQERFSEPALSTLDTRACERVPRVWMHKHTPVGG